MKGIMFEDGIFSCYLLLHQPEEMAIDGELLSFILDNHY